MSTVEDPFIKKLCDEIVALQHAVQSAVAFEIGAGRSLETAPKSLRVGVNSAMIDASAVAKVLIDKGIISELEYFVAVRDLWKRELQTYEQRNPGASFA